MKAIARLRLKKVADDIDAKEAMEFYNVILYDFKKTVVISQSPKDITYNECISLLKEVKEIGAISIYELIITVCKRNKQVAIWLGYEEGKSLRIDNNIKTSLVLYMMLNKSNIKIVGNRPIVLQWLSDVSDTSDTVSEDSIEKIGKVLEQYTRTLEKITILLQINIRYIRYIR